MDFFVKKTTEMTSEELEQLLNLYNNVFGENRSLNGMVEQYENNPLGFSYHSFFTDEGLIQGAITYIPAYYYYGGNKKVFANSVDTMIAKDYRDAFELLELIENGYDFLKENGVSIVFGYPNDKSFPVYMKSKTMNNIGKMRTYCLPYRIGGIKKGLSAFNFLSEAFAVCYAFTSSLFARGNMASFYIRKDDDSYNQTRYKRSDANYGIVDLGGFTLYYKIHTHEDVRTAFIIDVDKKSPRNFCKAVCYLLKNEKKNFDLILYPGVLPFLATGMIRIPVKYEPKNFHFTAKILDITLEKEKVLNINNWDTNLSNYDLI